jgi:hypothetical protein
MASDPEPPDGPSVRTIDTVWGLVVRTRDVLGIAAAVRLRRLARRGPEGVVVLDLRATSVAARVVAAAVADLAAGLRASGGVLRIVRSSRTPQILVDAAGAAVFTSLAEALGCRPTPDDRGACTIPARPDGRRPPATDGRPGMGPDRPFRTPGAPVRTHPTPLEVPRPRHPGAG